MATLLHSKRTKQNPGDAKGIKVYNFIMNGILGLEKMKKMD